MSLPCLSKMPGKSLTRFGMKLVLRYLPASLLRCQIRPAVGGWSLPTLLRWSGHLASGGCSEPETCSLWCPLHSAPPGLGRGTPFSVAASGPWAHLLTGPLPGSERRSSVAPGRGCRVPGAGPASGSCSRPACARWCRDWGRELSLPLPRAPSLPPSSPPRTLSCLSCAGTALQMPAGRPALGGDPQFPWTSELRPRFCCSQGTLDWAYSQSHPSETATPAGRRVTQTDGGCTGAPGRSRMRQDKLTGSLRRGGRCLKRQGGAGGSGGGGGGVGTILSNVLKKRSCISRTAPRLLCTLEPGEEDPGLQMGHWKVAWRRCLSWTLLRPGSAREPPGARHRGSAQAALVGLGGQSADQGLGWGSGLQGVEDPLLPSAARGPLPAACVRSSPACAGEVLAPARAIRGRATSCAPASRQEERHRFDTWDLRGRQWLRRKKQDELYWGSLWGECLGQLPWNL